MIEDIRNYIFFARNLGSGIHTASDILKFLIFLIILIIIIAFAVWFLGVLGTFQLLREKIRLVLGI